MKDPNAGLGAVAETDARWGVYDEDSEVHVVPMFGREHELSPTCWCLPTVETYAALLVIHNLVH